LRVGHGGSVRRHRADERVERRLARVELVLGNQLLLKQLLFAVKLDLGVLPLRRVTGQSRAGRIQRRLCRRESMVNSRSPLLTVWPSLKFTSLMMPPTCGRIVTDE